MTGVFYVKTKVIKQLGGGETMKELIHMEKVKLMNCWDQLITTVLINGYRSHEFLSFFLNKRIKKRKPLTVGKSKIQHENPASPSQSRCHHING